MIYVPLQCLFEVKDLDSKIDTIEVELKDFEGAVKLQAVTMEKLSENSRSKHKHSKDSEKMTETQRAVLEAKIMQVLVSNCSKFCQLFVVLSVSNLSSMWQQNFQPRKETGTRILIRSLMNCFSKD